MRNDSKISNGVKCSLCGLEFNIIDGVETSCKRCFLFRSCRLIRCPNCGYEMPVTPKGVKRLNGPR